MLRLRGFFCCLHTYLPMSERIIQNEFVKCIVAQIKSDFELELYASTKLALTMISIGIGKFRKSDSNI